MTFLLTYTLSIILYKTTSEIMTTIAGVSGTQLRQLIERIENLEEQKAHISEDIREVFSESKAMGFDTKVMRQIIKLRKMDHDERQEQEELLDIYRNAVGLSFSGVQDQEEDDEAIASL